MSKIQEEEINKKTLGNNIRTIRKRVKLTQDTFSEKIGIEPSSLSNIENGKSFPSALTIIQIQQQFNIKAEEILNIDNINNISIEKEIHSRVNNLNENQKNILWQILNLIEC